MKARVHASHTKQMVLAFFDTDKLIFTKMVKNGQSVNAIFNMETLGSFLKILDQNMSQLVEQGWMFDWDNAPTHTAAVVQKWLSAYESRYSNSLRICLIWLRQTISCYPEKKYLLHALRLTQETMKMTLDGVQHIVIKGQFAATYRRW